MNYEYSQKVVANKVTGNSYEPAGVVFETIELESRLFGNWGPASVPQSVVRDELAKAIADELMMDVEWNKDPRSGHSVAKFSSVVYMKPKLERLHQDNNDLRGELLSVRSKALQDKKLAYISLTKSQNESEKYMLKYLKYQGLYYEYLGNDNDWEYLLRRGLRLMWLNFKINLYSFSRFIPFRG